MKSFGCKVADLVDVLLVCYQTTCQERGDSRDFRIVDPEYIV